MAASAKDVMKMIADNEVKFVDFRFTDTRGKEQHVTVPVSHFDEDKFTHGHAFDGSSIAGWKGIEASDMLLMPDAGTANMDPFREEPTLILTCDVVEPSDGKGYDRDPRSLAKRAEAYLKSTGVGDTAYFGPEPEFFIFDSVTWNVDMSGCFVKINSEEAPWSTGREFEGGNLAHRPAVKGGYFPVPPVDSFQDMRSEMCLMLEQMGVPVEVHHHEVAAPGQCEIGTKFSTLVQRADWLQILKYVVLQRRAQLRQDRHLHAQAGRGRQRLGHARATSRSGRTATTCSPATSTRACRSSRCTTSAASSSTPARSTRSPIPAPTRTSAWCPASRRRSSWPTRRATARRRSGSRTSATRRAAASRSASRIRPPTRTWRSPRC